MDTGHLEAGAHVALVTIGQAPREDIASALRPTLGGTTLVQVGALDDMGAAEIEALAPTGDDFPLVSRLRDGREVIVGKEALTRHLSAAVDRVSTGAAAVALLCSGSFPEFEIGRSDDVTVVLPERALRARLSRELSSQGRLGVVAPLGVQADTAHAKWADVTPDVRATSASPYGQERVLRDAAEWLAGQQPDLVLLDCMGYVERHRAIVEEMTDVPVVSACSTLADALAEEARR